MAENVAGSVSAPEGSQDGSSGGRRRRRESVDLAHVWSRVIAILSSVIRWLGTVAAVLLVVHVVLAVGNANPQHPITRFVGGWADSLSLGFADLFQPADPKLAVLLNYGAAAVFWLIVTSLAVRILRAVG